MEVVTDRQKHLDAIDSGTGFEPSETDVRVSREITAQALGDVCGRVPGVVPPLLPQIDMLHRKIRDVLFPGCFGQAPLTEQSLRGHLLDELMELRSLLEELLRASYLTQLCDPQHPAAPASPTQPLDALVDSIAERFIGRLPELRMAALEDIHAAYDGDPAAEGFEEIILCYPGIEAVYAYRVAHALHELGVPILPRMITERAHARTGVDIHPAAVIGRACFIDHGTGVVIGQTASLGDRVTVYQGVTIGAKKFVRDAEGRMVRGIQRHPAIGNDVTIYAGAVILGGDTTIGDGCLISANVYITQSVPAGHVVRQKHGELQVLELPKRL